MSNFATNAEIDDLVLRRLRADHESRPFRGLTIGAIILGARFTLKPVPNGEQSSLWLAQEHGNRSCQRLRRKGLIRHDSKDGWLPVD